MTSKDTWNNEYSKKNFMTGTRPQKSFLRFIKDYKKKLKNNPSYNSEEPFAGVKVLDLGSGEGKNAFYLAERGAKVFALDFSSVAIKNAQKHKNIKYINQSFTEKLPFDDRFFDILLDITSSNSLREKERERFLSECIRVLKDDGVFFVRTLSKDADKNAKQLLKDSPVYGEKDMYKMPITGLVERVFSEKDLRLLYERFFEISFLEKESHYTSIGNKKFKRNFWIMHLLKKKPMV